MLIELLGDTFHYEATDGWLWLYADAPLLPFTVYVAGIDDGDHDANTSVSWFDDSAPHYIVGKTKVHIEGAGETAFYMHADELHWSFYAVDYECDDGALTVVWAHGITWDNGGEYHLHPEFESGDGFWMALQIEGDGDDPNNTYVKGAGWNGNKYDWDGTWNIEHQAVVVWDPNGRDYWPEGICGFTGIGSPYCGTTQVDSKYDEIECRWGTFTNVSRTLRVAKIKSTDDYGTVTIDPDLLDDPNEAYIDPNRVGDPNYYVHPINWQKLRRYTDGTEVMLVAEPAPDRGWKKWKIWDDPNQYPDPNYESSDTNTVIYLTMDKDYVVEAIFACSADSGVLPPIAMAFLTLLAGAMVRRLA
jgi:hypothetical protein